MARRFIEVDKARQNNLKGVSVRVPIGAVTAVTGVAGAGKSSLAFDVLYAEGHRRYAETFSPYARQFLERLDRPRAERIDGVLPGGGGGPHGARPHLALDGRHDDLGRRLPAGALRPRGHAALPAVRPAGAARHAVVDLRGARRGSRGTDAPSSRSRTGSGRRWGPGSSARPSRRRGSGGCWRTARPVRIEDARLHPEDGVITVVLDRDHDRAPPAPADRRLARGGARATARGTSSCGSRGRPSPAASARPSTARPATSPTPTRRPPSSPSTTRWARARPARASAGRWRSTPDLVVPDAPQVDRPGLRQALPDELLQRLPGRPRALLPARGAARGRAVRGAAAGGEAPRVGRASPAAARTGSGSGTAIDGLLRVARVAHATGCTCASSCRATAATARAPTAAARASRPRRASSASTAGRCRRSRRCRWPRPSARSASGRVPGPDPASEQLLHEIRGRLRFLVDVGLGYLTLGRQSRTLSGGEAQRVTLATALGGSLTSTLYVLDEPSVGLHPRDADRLSSVLRRLADAGNAVVVVEHDAALIASADHVIDLGPGPGREGGEVVYEGPVAGLLEEPRSKTGAYLAGPARDAAARRRRRQPDAGEAPRRPRRAREQPEGRDGGGAARPPRLRHRRLGLGQVLARGPGPPPQPAPALRPRRVGARGLRRHRRRLRPHRRHARGPGPARRVVPRQRGHLHGRPRAAPQGLREDAGGPRARPQAHRLLVQLRDRGLPGLRGRGVREGRDAVPARRLREVRGLRRPPLPARGAGGALQGPLDRGRARPARGRRGAPLRRRPRSARGPPADARPRPRLPVALPAGADALGRRGAAAEARAGPRRGGRRRRAGSTCSTSRRPASTRPTWPCSSGRCTGSSRPATRSWSSSTTRRWPGPPTGSSTSVPRRATRAAGSSARARRKRSRGSTRRRDGLSPGPSQGARECARGEDGDAPRPLPAQDTRGRGADIHPHRRRARAQPAAGDRRHPARQAGGGDRRLGLRQVHPRLRRALRRGPAALPRLPLDLRAPVHPARSPGPRWTASRACRPRWPSSRSSRAGRRSRPSAPRARSTTTCAFSGRASAPSTARSAACPGRSWTRPPSPRAWPRTSPPAS